MDKKIVVIVFSILFVSGCTTVQKGAGVGAVSGAALGGIIGNQSGSAGEGALIGAGAGALIGALAGDAIEKNKGEKPATKFCPKCGRRFQGEETVYCPYDGTSLEYVTE